MSDIPNRQNWFSVLGKNRIPLLKDKDALRELYARYMFIRTSKMFEYENLPETIPQRELERLLQIGSYAIIKKVKDDLFAFYGGLGGQPNEYYQPTMYTIANPYLKEFKVGKLDDYIKDDSDAVLIWNDSEHIGLTPLSNLYASLLAESVMSLRVGLVMSRIPAVALANSDTVKESAEEFFAHIDDDGETKVIIGEELLTGLKGLDIQSFNNSQNHSIKDIVEVIQYVKASWFNELGLDANYNMKRESINESEASLNEESLLPLVDDMLKQRQIGIEQINKKFGTNIKVKLSSSWGIQRKEIEQREEQKETEIDSSKEEENNDEK